MIKTYVVLAFTMIIVAPCVLHAQGDAQNPLAPYMPKNMKPYYLEMLIINDKPPAELGAGQSMELKQKHLAYLRSQVEAGKYL